MSGYLERLRNKSGCISDNDKWIAVVDSVKEYDGLFFYGVRTTGVFCRPSCKSKAPVSTNVVFFDNAEAALNAGYRPCKRCRPDKAEYQPDMELVQKLKELLHERYKDDLDFEGMTKQLGISQNHLIRIFKQAEGMTPLQYVNGLRAAKASELMRETDMDILGIAYFAGYKSVSAFYKSFKDITGYTPGKYRKTRG